MYDIHPPAVYAHESAWADPRYRARVERVLSAIDDPPPVEVYADADLPRLLDEVRIGEARKPMGAFEGDIPDPILLFNTFRFDDRREERQAWLKEACGLGGGNYPAALLGYGPFVWWDVGLATDDRIRDNICRPCWRVHFQNGCLHKCHYCGLGGLLVTMVNVEDYIERFSRLIDAHPWQETYLLEDDADILCLEPELGCLGPIIEFFGTLEERYVILHTKSWNVDWMADLEHNGNTVFVWSVSGRQQADRLEPVAGSVDERIAAAATAEAAGYPVRYKFKPIIPVPTWREDAAEAVAMIFEQTHPDLISLCVFMWMDIEEMIRRLGAENIDPDILARSRAAAGDIADSRCKPFPPDVREEIYRHYLAEIRKHDPDVPVSLSTENADMWRRMGAALECNATNYVCGCGPNSPPGRRRLTCNPFQIAAGGPVGGFERM